MNKESAEIYVKKSLNTVKIISRAYQYRFLLLNFFVFGIAFIVYPKKAFLIAMLCIYFINAFSAILLAKKAPCLLSGTVLTIIQLLVFCVALNSIVFAMYQSAQVFVLWEFIVSVMIQLLSIAVSFILIKRHAKKFHENERYSYTKTEAVAGTASGISYILVLTFCHVVSPSLSTFVTPVAILINILACLMSFATSSAIFRAYLIKKYNIN